MSDKKVPNATPVAPDVVSALNAPAPNPAAFTANEIAAERVREANKDMPADQVAAILSLFIEDKKISLEKSKVDAEMANRKDAAQRQQNHDFIVGVLDKQRRCNHLKGSNDPKLRMKSGGDDYMVYLHTFIDGSQQIKCNKCSMKWRPNDTREFLVRNGKKIFNHTLGSNGFPIGWEDALRMCALSSNKPSSSEVVLKGPAKPNEAAVLGPGGEIPEVEL